MNLWNSDNQKEFEDAVDQAPPYGIAKKSGFTNALDGKWQYMGTIAVQENSGYRIPCNCVNKKAVYWAEDTPIPSYQSYFCIAMERIEDDIWIGQCKNCKMMIWMRSETDYS